MPRVVILYPYTLDKEPVLRKNTVNISKYVYDYIAAKEEYNVLIQKEKQAVFDVDKMHWSSMANKQQKKMDELSELLNENISPYRWNIVQGIDTKIDFVRYITIPFETEGHWASNFYDQVEGIEEMFEEWFEEESHDFKDGEDGKEVAFYDEVGEKLFVEISLVRELLSMIASIRVIKCDTEIMN